MTREKFIKELDKRGYSYEIIGDNLFVTNGESFPSTSFSNVLLKKLKSIPENTIFKNIGNVDLTSVNNIPHGVEFQNEGNVYLNPNAHISNKTFFKNSGFIRKGDTVIRFDNNYDIHLSGISKSRMINLILGRGAIW